jgi:hypothetical protein
MPYTDDPENVPADAVRFLVGDTSTTKPDLTDSQIVYLLDEQGGAILRAAARAAETLSAKYSKSATERQVGPLMLRFGSRQKSIAEDFAALARLLWKRANMVSEGIFAGGISRTDKAVRELAPDRVRPAFKRRMQEYPSGAVVGGRSREELLSPVPEAPEVLP